eukprot:364804-Chlamydomonas_euryale.AAC.3
MRSPNAAVQNLNVQNRTKLRPCPWLPPPLALVPYQYCASFAASTSPQLATFAAARAAKLSGTLQHVWTTYVAVQLQPRIATQLSGLERAVCGSHPQSRVNESHTTSNVAARPRSLLSTSPPQSCHCY